MAIIALDNFIRYIILLNINFKGLYIIEYNLYLIKYLYNLVYVYCAPNLENIEARNLKVYCKILKNIFILEHITMESTTNCYGIHQI